ncbi:polyprenyl synthetase family protein [Proteiniborus sp. MB09-C3]|uniref:polyprenyl synthetase family protein n=1 Tax=Proteiniborus sp. MB09-C3 TaxID=3050072 RepID=UPI0025565C85|nr:polyprenyl synthetase family protein [Proteiniborus sp. MB09-C3]WIV13388.1 polyprenyl synthetase family protein [Proteiniborus sp. MB09-C3]
MNKFWNDYPALIEELNGVKSIIKRNIKSRETILEESILPMIESGGKMLRPAFLILASKFGEYDSKKISNLAAVIEMLHMATLIHDDIIDDARLRRGCDTIQYKYGKDYAVYIGDFLFCQCFNMLAKYDYDMKDLRNISKVLTKICMGEITQYNLRYGKNASLRNYIRIISGKTAALFAISFYTGANEAKCDESISNSLGKVGYNAGMAFQIIDDILDYSGNTERLGKSALRDLQKGYYTLPLIYALENDKDGRLKRLLDSESLSSVEIDEIMLLVDKYDGINRAKKVADKYTEKAIERIEKLPNCESKEIIRGSVLKLLNRDY